MSNFFCERCGSKNETMRCKECGHRMIRDQNIKEIMEYLGKVKEVKEKKS